MVEQRQTQPNFKYVQPRDPKQIAREQRILDDFIAGSEGIDPLQPE